MTDSSQLRILNDEFRRSCSNGCMRTADFRSFVRFDSFMIRNSESIPGSENPESTETEIRSCMHDGRPRRTAAAATVDPTMTKMPSKRGVTLAWRHSLGGNARPKKHFMCYLSLAPGSFLQLLQSGPGLEDLGVYFRSTSYFEPNTI